MGRTDELRALDAAHLWHPFTQMKAWPSEPPLVIERAEGNWLVDSDGGRYFDGVSSLWVTVHGHLHPELCAALRVQLEQLDHSTLLGLTHPPAIELAARLAACTPGGTRRVFYSECGASAVEIALKMAYQYWQHTGHPEKKTFVALAGAYHGDTIGAVSVGGIEQFHRAFAPLLFPVHRLPQPHCRRCALGFRFPSCDLACAAALAPLLEAHGDEICALVLEPKVQGAAGMIVQPPGYLARLQEIARSFDILVIADEVATGFGRTGPLFACELEGIEPDLICLGKGITGGVLPLAATLATDRIYEAFWGEAQELKTFFHGHTYTGNPLACAAALASLDLIEETSLLANVAARSEQLATGLRPMAELAHVVEVRQQGMMIGIELAEEPAIDRSYPFARRMGHRVTMAARAHGLIIRPLGDTVVLMPPLGSTAPEITHLIDGTEAAIREATEDPA